MLLGIFLVIFGLPAGPARAQSLNDKIVCDAPFLKELNSLFDEYYCLKQGGSACETPEENQRGLPRRKIGPSFDKEGKRPSQSRKIAEFLRRKPGVGSSLSGVAGAMKFVFRKVGGFYVDSIVSADSTADVCESEEHPYKTKPGDKVEVSKFIKVGVPSGTYKCELAFNLQDNQGLANFFDLPKDQDRLNVLKNKTACLYYYGVREHLEDEIFASRSSAPKKSVPAKR